MKNIFSPTEERILKTLGRKKMMITEIVDHLLLEDELPVGGNITVATAIRRINTKCEQHELPWYLNGKGGGRGGRMVWREKR